MLAMDRPVSIAEELATERMIRRLKGWRLASNRMASRDWSASGMAELYILSSHHATDSKLANTPLLLIAWSRPHTLRQVIDATRSVIEHEIDWPYLGVSRAITWFFKQVEEGIIYVRQPTSHRRGFRITMG
jgi:hypothetical protein